MNWTRVVSQGFGDPTNAEVFRFAVFSDTLYASTTSYTDTHGTEIWRSSTGNSGDWEQVGPDGFGDSNNWCTYWDNSVAVFNDRLYIGTVNFANGGEVWQLAYQVYLPNILKSFSP